MHTKLGPMQELCRKCIYDLQRCCCFCETGSCLLNKIIACNHMHKNHIPATINFFAMLASPGMVYQSVHHFVSTLKYLNNYWMDCHEIFYTHSWSPEEEP